MSVQPGDVISTPKGLITHLGIVTERGTVVHNSNAYGGVVETSLNMFSLGGRVKVERREGARGCQAARKALTKKGTRYDAFSWNCEHLVSWAFSGIKDSPQLTLGVGLGLLFLGLAYANSNSR